MTGDTQKQLKSASVLKWLVVVAINSQEITLILQPALRDVRNGPARAKLHMELG